VWPSRVPLLLVPAVSLLRGLCEFYGRTTLKPSCPRGRSVHVSVGDDAMMFVFFFLVKKKDPLLLFRLFLVFCHRLYSQAFFTRD
jgi:hypothetical protein